VVNGKYKYLKENELDIFSSIKIGQEKHLHLFLTHEVYDDDKDNLDEFIDQVFENILINSKISNPSKISVKKFNFKKKKRFLQLKQIDMHFDEEELNVYLRKQFYPTWLTTEERSICVKIECKLKESSLLFELDLVFDSGETLTLTFSKNCSSFVPLKTNSSVSKKKKSLAKKPQKHLKKSIKSQVHLQANTNMNIYYSKRSSFFGCIFNWKTLLITLLGACLYVFWNDLHQLYFTAIVSKRKVKVFKEDSFTDEELKSNYGSIPTIQI
jgi:hypothetical protein